MSAVRDTYYVYGRRVWADGMTLEADCTVEVCHADDGGMVLTLADEEGAAAMLVIPAGGAPWMRQVQEMLFCGTRMLMLAGD